MNVTVGTVTKTTHQKNKQESAPTCHQPQGETRESTRVLGRCREGKGRLLLAITAHKMVPVPIITYVKAVIRQLGDVFDQK